MLDRFVVVDYHKGAGGEFLANVISAHWGHPLVIDQMAEGSPMIKWLNINSVSKSDWIVNFRKYFLDFLSECEHKGVERIAVPYHLCQCVDHLGIILEEFPSTRFVKINSTGYEKEISADGERKVDHKVLGAQDLPIIKTLVDKVSRDKKKYFMDLFRMQQLTYKHILPPSLTGPMPSNDIEVSYRDFFYDIDKVSEAYNNLCEQLDLRPQKWIEEFIILRNKKNHIDRNDWMATK